MRCIPITAFLALTAASTQSFAFDGNKLLEFCSAAERRMDGLSGSESSTFEVGVCMGYLSGMRDATTVWQGTSQKEGRLDGAGGLCWTDDGPSVTNGQLVRIVVKYLREHPESLHMPALANTLWAYQNAFPCLQR